MKRLPFVLALMLAAVPIGAMEGTLRDTVSAPIPYAYLGIMTQGFQPVTDALSEANGSFSLAEPVADSFLVVQPTANADADGMNVFTHSPRLYQLPVGAEKLDLRLPAIGNMILEAYAADGTLMRWQDFQKNGEYAGRFAYAVNMDDEAIPYECWPVHGSLTGSKSGSRESGVPAILVAPEQTVAVNLLFWPTQGYGKLLIKADNAGQGYQLDKPGASQRLLVNLELARTAIADLTRRKALFQPEEATQIDTLVEQLAAAATAPEAKTIAARADKILVEALRLRDQFELARAERTWRAARQGTLRITAQDTGLLPGATITVKQDEHAFLFGAYEGAPFNKKAFEQARTAGFNLATVLLGWNWTNSPKLNRAAIDKTFGISALDKMGYTVKAHGVIWMQEYGILPDDARQKKHAQLVTEALDHQKVLMEVFGENIAIWEAVNEPANTNVVNLSQKDMIDLVKSAAHNVHEISKPTLINNPHEFSHGSQYLIYKIDNSPLYAYPMTYSVFLSRAAAEKALDETDIIALQVYPGYHLNDSFAGAQGPAFTPSYLLDTVERYTRFGKRIHLSEFSLPSTYGDDWFAGYWREPWTEETQADYADAVLALLFAHPQVDSVGWWDLTDNKPSVLTGGLVNVDGSPKKAFTRIAERIAQWRTVESLDVKNESPLEVPATAGTYTITLNLKDGRTITDTATVTVGATTDVMLASP